MIEIISDIHYLRHKGQVKAWLNYLNANQVKYVLLPGDIEDGVCQEAFEVLSGFKGKIIRVLGNHDHWSHTGQNIEQMQVLHRQKQPENMVLLQNQTYEIPELNTVICGSTLWTDWAYDPCKLFLASQLNNDFNYVYVNPNSYPPEVQAAREQFNKSIPGILKQLSLDGFTFDEKKINRFVERLENPTNWHPMYAAHEHQKGRAFLAQSIKEAKAAGKKVIAMTHHPADMRVFWAAGYALEKLASSVPSERQKYFSKIIGYAPLNSIDLPQAPDCWVHGHVHMPVNYNLNHLPTSCQVLSNPMEHAKVLALSTQGPINSWQGQVIKVINPNTAPEWVINRKVIQEHKTRMFNELLMRHPQEMELLKKEVNKTVLGRFLQATCEDQSPKLKLRMQVFSATRSGFEDITNEGQYLKAIEHIVLDALSYIENPRIKEKSSIKFYKDVEHLLQTYLNDSVIFNIENHQKIQKVTLLVDILKNFKFSIGFPHLKNNNNGTALKF